MQPWAQHIKKKLRRGGENTNISTTTSGALRRRAVEGLWLLCTLRLGNELARQTQKQVHPTLQTKLTATLVQPLTHIFEFTRRSPAPFDPPKVTIYKCTTTQSIYQFYFFIFFCELTMIWLFIGENCWMTRHRLPTMTQRQSIVKQEMPILSDPMGDHGCICASQKVWYRLGWLIVR